MGNLDEKTFRVNFSGDGAAKLREALTHKLKEFMGDYTDDTLVEYVVVLLRNGRSKDEAKNELNVFLGDDSDSFVSWLWDHLSSNLNLYVQQEEVHAVELPRKKSVQADHDSKIAAENDDLEPQKGTLDNLSRGRHKREWKGLGRDEAQVPPLTSSEFEDMHIKEKTRHKVNHARSSSPKRQPHKKRSRHEEQQRPKREPASHATIAAPRRLLQFAVRDAVESLMSPGSVEPAQKRLHSVVSTSSEDASFVDQPRRLQSIARVPNAMSTVVRAVQEAAEDVRKVKHSVSVFDRLGRDTDLSGTGEQVTHFRDFAIEDEYEEFHAHDKHPHLNYIQRSGYGRRIGSINMMERESGMDHDVISENEAYNDVNMSGRVINTQHAGIPSGMRAEDSIMMQYKVAKSSDDSMLFNRMKDQNLSLQMANTSRKIASNVKPLKPPHYQESKGIELINIRKPVQENQVDTGKLGARPMKENSNPVTVGNGDAKLAADIEKDPLKIVSSGTGSHAAGHLLEDADSRTIFVSNVHFAATKDSLSRHFNKFGEILKVVIVTDATTGQPKGSAYVEFMYKEAADNALSLDGTSFMSRILKAVKRSSASVEATPNNTTWPRVARGSPYSTARFSRGAFSRGLGGGFRPHLTMKPGARSLQWKRDAQGSAAESGAQPVSGHNFVPPTPRSLTYVRTDPKPDGNSSRT